MKKFIDKILNVPKLIRRIWILLWIILIILLILKICFNQWYPIVITNESFKNICNFIDDRKWLSSSIIGFFYIINSNILFLTCMGNKKYSKWYITVLMIILNIVFYILKLNFNFIGFIIEITLVFISIIINLKMLNFKNKIIDVLMPILIYVILNLWQFTIYFIRDLDIEILSSLPFLLGLILQLDYYIFTIITWIGVSFMGAWGWGWLWSKDVTVLKAHREKELLKKNPDMSLVERIDERIAELEKEGK